LNLQTPFVYEGFKYASDAIIAIRQPTNSSLNEPDIERPNLGRLFRSINFTLARNEFPDNFESCEGCEQSGVIKKFKCSFCQGEGYLTCNLGHDHECVVCRGDGLLNTGPAEDKVELACENGSCDVVIGHTLLARRYVQLVAGLPGPIFYCDDGELLWANCGQGIQVIVMGKGNKK